MIRNEGYSVRPSAGFIGRINYNYADRYLLELSGRYDGSFIFPGISVGVLSFSFCWMACFFRTVFANSVLSNYISNLKFRVSMVKWEMMIIIAIIKFLVLVIGIICMVII